MREGSQAFSSFVDEEEDEGENDTPHYMFDIVVQENEEEMKMSRSQK